MRHLLYLLMREIQKIFYLSTCTIDHLNFMKCHFVMLLIFAHENKKIRAWVDL